MRLSVLFVAALLVFGCDKKQEGNKDGMYESADNNSDSKSTPEETPAPPATTTIEFTETEYDFGTINEGAMASHNFKFKNTGSHPLIITSAKADCGCTVPDPPKEPIMPGQESQIEVKFNSSGKGGQTINKTITVVANTEAPSLLYMKGRVIGKDEGKPLRK